ncbi:hypothetical protein AX14_006484 [Amanita brunnescens Koide BX004]|nr:hypothetical protein AX14_006484 [Amanita brunnescens Koide BX004]
MPLVPNAVYTIRNELTHTVLGLEGNNAGGYGGVGKDIQQWRLVKQAGNNEWMLHNQRTEDHHVLRSPSDNSRLVVANAGTRRTFVIESIQGSAERYRITLGQLAATLITGSTPQDPNILENDRVFDLQADGAPLVLRGVPVHPSPIDSAQLWSFIPVVELPVKPGTYKIISSHARLVLDLQGGAVDTNGTHTLNNAPTPASADFLPFIISSWREEGRNRRRPEVGHRQAWQRLYVQDHPARGWGCG